MRATIFVGGALGCAGAAFGQGSSPRESAVYVLQQPFTERSPTLASQLGQSNAQRIADDTSYVLSNLAAPGPLKPLARTCVRTADCFRRFRVSSLSTLLRVPGSPRRPNPSLRKSFAASGRAVR